MEMPGLNGIWSLRESEHHEFDKYLVHSFTGVTKILGIDNDEMTEVCMGFIILLACLLVWMFNKPSIDNLLLCPLLR